MSKWLENSDYASRFLQLHERNISGAYSPAIAPPETVLARLESYDLMWHDLSNLVQQAIIWDSGYVIGTVNGIDQWLQVYVPCGSTMADIALPITIFQGTGETQKSRTCDSPVGKYKRQQSADFIMTDTVTRCAIQDTSNKTAYSHSSIVSQDALRETQIPEPRIFMHTDGNGFRPSIHTLPRYLGIGTYPEVAWDTCNPPTQGAGMVIPCGTKGLKSEGKNVCVPKLGIAVETFLKSARVGQSSQPPATSQRAPDPDNLGALPNPIDSTQTSQVQPMNMNQYWGIGGASTALMLLFFGWTCYRYKKQKGLRSVTQPQYIDVETSKASPASDFRLSGKEKELEVTTFTQTNHQVTGHSLGSTDADSISFDQTHALHQLHGLHHIDFRSIEFSTILSQGKTASVYHAYLNGRSIAAKTLQTHCRGDKMAVDSFANEISLMASLNHPNLVKFVGYTWLHNVSSLIAATEFVEKGNLRSFLDQYPDMEWQSKAPLALDIARALQYLHVVVSPHIVHRNLQSKNVLIEWPSAKLSIFGISRQRITSNIEELALNFYVAPEVLRHEPSTTAADMYAFGCILVEFETHEPLYSNYTYQPRQAAKKILEEGLVPTMPSSCPEPLRLLAEQCLQQDPTHRPSAFDAAYILRTFITPEGYSRLV